MHVNDIAAVYHPGSQQKTKVEHFSNYMKTLENTSEPQASEKHDQEPFYPFATRLDFQFAEVALAAHLSRSQTEAMLNIIKEAVEGKSAFTLSSFSQLQKTWAEAEKMHTAVCFFDFLLTFII